MSPKDSYGVLLYYKYAIVDDLESLLSFYQTNCECLSLLGRVRLSTSGVNVTVGGEMRSLEKHIEAVKSISLFHGTDFKLASCDFPLNDDVARECGFTSLSIRIVKELVTFRSSSVSNVLEVSNAGEHLTATEFHSVLHNADAGEGTEDDKVVLLDARNVYETRIGKFCSKTVTTLDPEIRQYSDLPAWIDDHVEQLRGKQVLMYCTGGIRCEMASAYIKSKGEGFENVYQLYGGIQRYLEQFPDGGFFRGKNFVFDHRISAASSDSTMLGSCLLCGISFDDYSSRCRCSVCRMLVLVCNKCQAEQAIFVCELCRKQGRETDNVSSYDAAMEKEIEPDVTRQKMLTNSIGAHPSDRQVLGGRSSKKLRILCLHGFRQNASTFKGRTASLAKKLKNFVEFVYIDAPHELPLIYKGSSDDQISLSETMMSDCNAIHTVSGSTGYVMRENRNKRFAWLIAANPEVSSQGTWDSFDPLQYKRQTEGFEDSVAHVDDTLSEQGPFDGIMGFSQGAAMAAMLCAHKQAQMNHLSFRFAILCSGFGVDSEELLSSPINCPSLHIFGGLVGKDRQISVQASRDLATLFRQEDSVVIEHDCGHIIPTRPPYIDDIRDFLRGFL